MPSDGKNSPSELKMYKACPMIIHVQFGFNQNPIEHFFFKFTNMVLNKLQRKPKRQWNIKGHKTQNDDKQNKTKTLKTKKMNNTDPPNKLGVNPVVCEL